ncbi:hypothetical protein GW17_00054375 [Ensete ventricosum]|nr:hypothetical protein GW17_00054375 [Ensete ventricosum]
MTRVGGHVAAEPSGHVGCGRVQTGRTERSKEKGDGGSHFSPPQSVPPWAPRRTPARAAKLLRSLRVISHAWPRPSRLPRSSVSLERLRPSYHPVDPQ